MGIREYEKELRNKKGIDSYFSMCAAQDREMTPDMVVYEDNEYSIKIIDEKAGFLTCTIRSRKSQKLLHKVKFEKKPRLGVVYSFRDSSRLNLLAFSPTTLAKIEVLPASAGTPATP